VLGIVLALEKMFLIPFQIRMANLQLALL
jgi:hypothetical protein